MIQEGINTRTLRLMTKGLLRVHAKQFPECFCCYFCVWVTGFSGWISRSRRARVPSQVLEAQGVGCVFDPRCQLTAPREDVHFWPAQHHSRAHCVLDAGQGAARLKIREARPCP